MDDEVSRRRRARIAGVVAVIVALGIGGLVGAALREPKASTPKVCVADVRAFKRYAAIVSEQGLRLPTRISADNNGKDPSQNDTAQQRDLLSTFLQIERAAPSSGDVAACLGKSG